MPRFPKHFHVFPFPYSHVCFVSFGFVLFILMEMNAVSGVKTKKKSVKKNTGCAFRIESRRSWIKRRGGAVLYTVVDLWPPSILPVCKCTACGPCCHVLLVRVPLQSAQRSASVCSMFYTLLPLGGLEGNSLSPLRMSQTDFQLRGGKNKKKKRHLIRLPSEICHII